MDNERDDYDMKKAVTDMLGMAGQFNGLMSEQAYMAGVVLALGGATSYLEPGATAKEVAAWCCEFATEFVRQNTAKEDHT